jgi:AraC family transcriptional regulator
MVDEIAEEIAPGQNGVRIVPGLGALDPLLEQIAIGLREQLDQASQATALYVDHLARTAAARLVCAHSTAGLARARPLGRGGLGAEPLRRAIDYIEANLAEDISLPELATVTGLSPVYFARQFKRATGLAPHQYLLGARAARARRLLALGTLPTAAIALECGFCHQEHLTRVFRKRFGVTPGAYRTLARS